MRTGRKSISISNGVSRLKKLPWFGWTLFACLPCPTPVLFESCTVSPLSQTDYYCWCFHTFTGQTPRSDARKSNYKRAGSGENGRNGLWANLLSPNECESLRPRRDDKWLRLMDGALVMKHLFGYLCTCSAGGKNDRWSISLPPWDLEEPLEREYEKPHNTILSEIKLTLLMKLVEVGTNTRHNITWFESLEIYIRCPCSFLPVRLWQGDLPLTFWFFLGSRGKSDRIDWIHWLSFPESSLNIMFPPVINAYPFELSKDFPFRSHNVVLSGRLRHASTVDVSFVTWLQLCGFGRSEPFRLSDSWFFILNHVFIFFSTSANLL